LNIEAIVASNRLVRSPEGTAVFCR
jgi:hypothetical protein